MNTKHKKIFNAIFTDPINENVEWRKIEALFLALGAEVEKGKGSRVTFILKGLKLDIHRPHPGTEALRYRVKGHL